MVPAPAGLKMERGRKRKLIVDGFMIVQAFSEVNSPTLQFTESSHLIQNPFKSALD